MEIGKQIVTYCKYCNKHTPHKVKVYSASKARGLAVGTRRHNRAIKGYVGSVEPEPKKKKLGKKQVVVLTCTVCNKSEMRTITFKTRKKLEIKR